MDVPILRIYLTTLSELHLKSHIDKCRLVVFVPHPTRFFSSLFVCLFCSPHSSTIVLMQSLPDVICMYSGLCCSEKLKKMLITQTQKKPCHLQDAVANLEQGIVTERQCTQLVEQHEAAQDWLREQVKSLGPPPADRQSLHSAVNTLKVRKRHAFKRLFKHLWLVINI